MRARPPVGALAHIRTIIPRSEGEIDTDEVPTAPYDEGYGAALAAWLRTEDVTDPDRTVPSAPPPWAPSDIRASVRAEGRTPPPVADPWRTYAIARWPDPAPLVARPTLPAAPARVVRAAARRTAEEEAVMALTIVAGAGAMFLLAGVGVVALASVVL